MKADTLRSVFAVSLFMFALLSLISFFVPDYSLNAKLQHFLRGTFGLPSLLVPFISGIFGMLLIESIHSKLKEPRILIGLFVLLLSLSGLFHVFIPKADALDAAQSGSGGGMVGYKLAFTLINSVSIYAAVLILFALFLVSLVVMFDISLDRVLEFLSVHKPNISVKNPFSALGASRNDASDDDAYEVSMGIPASNPEPVFQTAVPLKETVIEVVDSMSEPQSGLVHEHQSLSSVDTSSSARSISEVLGSNKIWQSPPLELLNEPPSETYEDSAKDARSKIIKDTLKSFGVDVDVKNVQTGASVTRYSLESKSVARISKIASLHENLAMALASSTGSVRIEAPIPGTSLIGIEVPNSTRSMVYFKSLITSESMRGMRSKLAITLGKDVAGNAYSYDIAKMPHMLIAGTTGSGKSIFIHNILFSILYRASPQEVKFILIDPKRVELSLYKNVPHLITPVLTDMEKAPSVFNWAVNEMDRRYKLFENARVKNIESYNEKSGVQVMPYIVLIVDELAEIMIQDPRGVEKSIIRLAQLARATGIHLVLAVQRPSTDIITGMIKANIPCRVAFNVPSQIDSRVIIDQPGAEKLLGKGDMLFIPPDAPKPIRLQGAMVSEAEVNRLVDYLISQGVDPQYREEILQMEPNKVQHGDSEYGDVDAMFDEAVDIVTSMGKASASLLQRKLSIGYARAARIMDQLEENHIIGPAKGGSQTRDVLIDRNPTSPLQDFEEDNFSEPLSE